MSTMKQISIEIDGKTYSSKWSVWAARQFMRSWMELDAKKDQMGEMAYSLGMIQAAEDTVQGMLVRAGMKAEMFEDLDADDISELSSAVTSWYMANMTKLTKAITPDEVKNEESPTEEAITTP